MMRQFAILLCMTLIFLSLNNAAAQAQDKKNPIKIGYSGAMSGNIASYGNSVYRGVQYAVKKANENGGILGREVIIVAEDDACDQAMASTAATKLLSNGLNLIIGHTCSGPTKSALSVYGDNAIVISASVTDMPITEEGKYPMFFRTIARDDAQSKLLLSALKKKNIKKVALIHDKGDYGLGVANLTKSEIEKDKDSGIEIVLFDGITTGQVDYSPIVLNIKKSGAEAVVFGGYYPEMAKLAMQMRKKKMDVLILGSDGLKDSRYIELAGPASEGSIAVGPINFNDNDLAKKAIEDHKKEHNEEPGVYYVYAIAATDALLNAIEKAGSADDLQKIKSALKSEKIDTPMGNIGFDEKGDTTGATFELFEVKDGDFVRLN